MTKFQVKHNGLKIYAYTNHRFAKQVNHLLHAIIQTDEIHDQTTVKFGTFIYSLTKMSETEYSVLVPDFKTDYFQKTKDLSYSLNIIRLTALYAKALSLEPTAFDVLTTVLVEQNVTDKNEFICQKFNETNRWEITSLNSSADFNIEIPAYELLKLHPKLFSLLFLPNDYMVLFKNGRYTVINSFDQPVLEIRAQPTFNIERLNDGGTTGIVKDKTWTLTNTEGISVPYPNGYPDFKTAGLVDGEVNIGKFVERGADIRKADKLAPEFSGKAYTWHHDAVQNGLLQAVQSKYHTQFLHSGGISRFVTRGK